MDSVSSECESSCQSDLVFVMSGGAYSGKSLPVKTKKCILAFDGAADSTQQARCAIFRGDAGVTVRNLDSRVLVNGEVRAEHWLQMGDRIEFPNSIVLEVSQLGCTSSDSAYHPSPFQADSDSDSSGLMIGTTAPSSFSSEPWTEFDDPESNLDNDNRGQDQRLGFDKTPPNGGSSSSELSSDLLNSVETRFHEIEERLIQLADQISSLVTLASCGKLSTTAMPESDWKKQLANFSDEDPSTQQPTTTSAESNGADLIQPESLAPTSRFNVAEFGLEPVASNPEPTPVKTERCEAQIEMATEVFSGNDPSTLVPLRRLPHEIDSISKQGPSELAISENQSNATSTTVTSISGLGLSQLIESLGQSETVEPASNDMPAQQSTNEATFGGSSKFSTLGAIEPAAAAVESASSVTKSPNSEAVAKTASVDDEIDALLNRLFDGKSAPSHATSTDSIPDQSGSAPNKFKAITNELGNDSTLQVTHAFDDNAASNQVSSSLPAYNEIKFGYDLDSKGTNPDTLNQEREVRSTPSAATGPSTKSSPTESVAISEQEVAEESVLDLLARLKKDGCWDASETESNKADLPDTQTAQDIDLSSIDSTPLDSAPIDSAPIDSSPIDSSPIDSTSTKMPELEPRVETPVVQPSVAAPDSVEDYMNQLLARMGGAGLDAAGAPQTKEQKIAAKAKQAQAAMEEASHSAELMTAEEYVPKQKAAKIEFLETMREIANTNARTAVAFSDLDRRKARGLMQCLIGVGAFIMAAYYFLFVSAALADTAFFVGFVCLLITGGTGYLAFNTFKGTGILKDLFPQLNQDK